MLTDIFVSAVTVNGPDTTNSVRIIPGTGIDNPCGLVVNTGCDGLLLKYRSTAFSNSSGFTVTDE